MQDLNLEISMNSRKGFVCASYAFRRSLGRYGCCVSLSLIIPRVLAQAISHPRMVKTYCEI